MPYAAAVVHVRELVSAARGARDQGHAAPPVPLAGLPATTRDVRAGQHLQRSDRGPRLLEVRMLELNGAVVDSEPIVKRLPDLLQDGLSVVPVVHHHVA